MGAAQGILRRLVDFYREMDRGLAVMRGEEPVAGRKSGIDWSRSVESASIRRRRGGRSVR